jgi:hypothetical protein
VAQLAGGHQHRLDATRQRRRRHWCV